jgi:hypothetical protein
MIYIAKYKRTFFVITLVLFVLTFMIAILGIFCGQAKAVKLLNSSALILSIAGLIQLEITGLFEKVFDYYADEGKYQYGPPSHFTRELIETHNPEAPIRTWLWINLYENRMTSFWILVTSIALQLVAVWLE